MLRVLLVFALSVAVFGCGGEGPTAQLCEASGGVWKEVADCPDACLPPEPTADACANIEDTACLTVCGDVAACSCPEDKPFWEDGEGCVGFDACPADTAPPDTGGVEPEPTDAERRTELLECVIQEDGCDVLLEPTGSNEIYLQGAGYYRDDGVDHSGQTVCIAAGTYKHLNFSGLRGTEASPILITNCGDGQVVVDREGEGSTLVGHGSAHLKLSGTGNPDQAYGIVLQNAGSGNMGIDMQSGASDIEVEYLEISGTAYAGIAIRTYPYCEAEFGRDAFSQNNTVIHHNYVHDVGGEGMYLGPSHYHEETSPTSTEDCAPGLPEAALKGVRVYNNLIENVGRDGIQVGAAIEDMEIYDNVIRRYALEEVYGHVGGIQINPGSVGRVYRNYIESEPSVPDNAFQFAGGVDGPTYLYNNVIVGSSTPFVGLGRMGNSTSPVHFLNNTAISRADSGKTLTLYCIDDEEQPFTFKNNIFTEYQYVGSYIYTDSAKQAWTYLVGNEHAENCPINGQVHANSVDEDQVLAGNLYAPDAGGVGFVDFENGDYHLSADSPAVGAGENLGALFSDDFEGLERGKGAYDFGAYRY